MIFYLKEIQDKIGYQFKDSILLKKCFTHSSYSNIHKDEECNERLEFLGDSVLGLVVTDYLYNNMKSNEGQMTTKKQTMVSTKPLAEVVRNLGIDNYLILGDENTHHTDKLCENLYESIVGGIYLDGGLDCAKAFIYSTLINKKDIKAEKEIKDYKGKLNEFLQKKKKGVSKYELVSKEGSDHDPTFTVCLLINDKKICDGKGKSKKAAEQVAAKKGLEKLRKG